jgi:hypothetical protein
MWSRWITSGQFDGDPKTPSALAQEFALARQGGLRGWEPIEDALRRHVRDLLRRPPTKENVKTAVRHLRANADAGNSVAAAILSELSGIAGTAEWDRWRAEDLEEAEEMACYVSAHVTQALGDRDWGKAREETERFRNLESKRRERRARGGGS